MNGISRIFENRNIRLKKLLEKVAQNKSLDRIYKDALEVSLREHSHFAKLENETLTVTVDGPLWATRLLYEIPNILKNLHTQKEFRHIKNIRYVVTAAKTLEKKKSKPAKISAQNEQLWQELLKHLNCSGGFLNPPNKH